jgi:N-methylhydantoinase A/oxoprolinase/acetone carboxylase beta subunit
MDRPTGLVDIGIDIGGTFTDVVCRRLGEPMRIAKIMSTRGDPGAAVLQAIRFMVADWGIDPGEIAHFLHGTTIATNAVLERKGARIGLLTTFGFKDVLEIGRQMRQQIYSMILHPETPVFLAAGRLRKEIPERISPRGEVLRPIDEAAVLAAVEALLAEGVQAIAVCYLFSFLNPAHEQRTRALILDRHPGLPVSISSEVDPAFREYERTTVTAFDAYMKPVIERYLAHLDDGLKQAGITAPLQIMQSRGGLSVAAVARQRPVRLFMSGPAAGVIGGTIAGRMAGFDDLITIDIGGTSSDIALVSKGQPVIRPEGRIDGFAVRVPMVDVNAIGAGGGSIAWIDRAGGLRVGPHSAGADPGPACYAKGGDEATVTDASMVLGYLDPAYFAGGTIRLDAAPARAVIARRVAEPLGMTVEAAALGIHRVINAQMVEGIRLVSIRQGFDPRQFTLVALGGAGPVHATALARELGIPRIVIPRAPGVLSAAGLLAARIEHEVSAAFGVALDELAMPDLLAALKRLDARCAALMHYEGVLPAEVEINYFADVWYVGQSYSLEVKLRLNEADPRGQLYRDFTALHDRIYGYATEAPAAIVNLRSTHAARGADTLGEGAYQPQPGDPEKQTRQILVAGGQGKHAARVYDRARLPPGTTLPGPAIVEQADTTTLVEPGWQGVVMDDGTLLLQPQ